MSEVISLSSGIKKMSVIMDDEDTGRVVSFNPLDQGFAESIYGLIYKISQIYENKEKEYQDEKDIIAKFEIRSAEDKSVRCAVDSLFGAGFCNDVFKVRLSAVSDGVTVIENFLLAILDEMDDSVTKNIAKRDAKIKKYTEKYSKYKKYHN